MLNNETIKLTLINNKENVNFTIGESKSSNVMLKLKFSKPDLISTSNAFDEIEILILEEISIIEGTQILWIKEKTKLITKISPQLSPCNYNFFLSVGI